MRLSLLHEPPGLPDETVPVQWTIGVSCNLSFFGQKIGEIAHTPLRYYSELHKFVHPLENCRCDPEGKHIETWRRPTSKPRDPSVPCHLCTLFRISHRLSAIPDAS